jgi:hypothetical protein
VNRLFNATAHKQGWFLQEGNFASVYDYDAAEDGPECEAITRILARHTTTFLTLEEIMYKRHMQLDVASRVLYGKPDNKLTRQQAIRVFKTLATKLLKIGLA